MEYWRYAGLVGQLSQPIGDRRLEFIGESPDAGELDEMADAKYIVWDETVPLPPILASRAASVTPAAGFLVLSLP